jgi:hypothetical protein
MTYRPKQFFAKMEAILNIVNQLEANVRSVIPPQYLAQVDNLVAQGHPMSKNFPLMNLFHCLLITVFYLLSVGIGRRLMKNRAPFRLKWVVVYHNFFLICLSLWMGTTILAEALKLNLPFRGASVSKIGPESSRVTLLH